jgi:hypothetical protein
VLFRSPFVIASSDEGLQINYGRRLGFAGSGYNLPHFALAAAALCTIFSPSPVLTSMQEDDWLASQLKTKNPNLYQETLQQFAKQHQLTYIGQFDYGDPRALDDNLTRGHIVRPQKIHVADQICFTLSGGEQVYNLRQLVISADYLHALTPAQAKAIIVPQVTFYQQLLSRPLKFTFSTTGPLSPSLVAKNRTHLEHALAAVGS